MFRHIWLDPETVCYLAYDSDQAPTGPAPPDRISGRRDFRNLHTCSDYRGRRDCRVSCGFTHVPIPEVDLTDLVTHENHLPPK